MPGALKPIAVTGASIIDQETGEVVFVFDATLSETHVLDAEVTKHPVEEKADITDNIRIQPFFISCTGIITNTPISPEALANDPTQNRIASIWDSLIILFKRKRKLTLVTGLMVYENLVFSRMNTPRGAPLQDIRPSFEFEQIIIASTVEVPIPPDILRADVKNGGQSKNDLGQQGAKDSTEAEKREFYDSKDSALENIRQGWNPFSAVTRGF